LKVDAQFCTRLLQKVSPLDFYLLALLLATTEMPNVTLIRSHLFDAIGRQFTDKEFDELCFEFGVEVDDVETQVIEVNLLNVLYF